jgi:hypothetical protein
MIHAADGLMIISDNRTAPLPCLLDRSNDLECWKTTTRVEDFTPDHFIVGRRGV